MKKYGLALLMAVALSASASAMDGYNGPFSFLCNLLPGLCFDDTNILNQIAALQSSDTAQNGQISDLQSAVDDLNTEVGDIINAIGPCEAFEGQANWVACNGTCVNTDDDFNNCGACGNACTVQDSSCTNGMCVLKTCPPVQCKINTLQEDGSCAITGNQGTGTPCDDGLYCTTMDKCNGAGVCTGTAFACMNGQMCVETNPPTCQ